MSELADMEQSMSETVASEIAALGTGNLFEERNLPALADVEPLRWKVMVDCDGERIGTIETIEADEETGRVEFVEVGRGGFLGFGADRFLVPVICIVEVEQNTVRIDRSSTSLEGIPAYEPDRLGDPVYFESVRRWWGQDETLHEPGDE
jgi:sporulation protein YlmC with PRC-barrel domain